MKRFEEIKNEFENTGKYMNTVGYNAIDDLIQMVDLLMKRDFIEHGNTRTITIYFKDYGIFKGILNRILTHNDKTLEFVDILTKKLCVFNMNEIVYYTLKEGEENV